MKHDIEVIIVIWDTLSPVYDLGETVINGKVFRGIADEIGKYINADDDVLECACGTGLLSLPVAERCHTLVATDSSIGMLNAARKKLAGFDNVKLRRMDIMDIPYRAELFDAVIAANVIHLLDDPQRAADGLRRVCKKGGRIIIPTYIDRSEKTARRLRTVFSAIGIDFKRSFDCEQYKDFIESLGFDNVSYSLVDGRMPCVFAIVTR